MKRICSWCGKEKRVIHHHHKGLITHTICEKCAKMIRLELKDTPKEPALTLLDTYDLIEH